jgi:tetratricopeptide (TPR) repeat protein
MLILFLFVIVIGAIFFAIFISSELAKLAEIFNRAETVRNKDRGNPLELDRLEQSVKLYEQCNRLLMKSPWLQIAANFKIVDRNTYLNIITRLDREIERRQHFRILYYQGKKQIDDKYFDLALATFLKAQNLFSTNEVAVLIIKCDSQVKVQKQYEQTLDRATILARSGKFQSALDLLQPTLIEFDRIDGTTLLNKLKQAFEVKQKFAKGLQLEQSGKFNDAKNYYQQVLNIAPDLTECRIRLAVAAIKSGDATAVLADLSNVDGERAAYLRGFACVIQSNWRQADKEWNSLSHPEIKSQRQHLKTLARQDRLLTMQKIEQFVNDGNLDRAKQTSLQFINKFGVDPLVENNLYGHIQPLLETNIWKTQDWSVIATAAEQFWLESHEISSLHNWAVSSYYQAYHDPDKIADLIIAWSTALANIDRDPALRDVPWLPNLPPDLERVSTNLIELLEKLIDPIKDKDLDRYLQLRDLYRWQIVTLRLTKNSPHTGVRINQILLSPGCYQRHINTIPQSDLPAEPWSRLYTNWGPAVAACIEGDTDRALQIKPQISSVSVAEKSANSFITYHEGCYYLQQYQWRKAIKPFKQVRAEIKNFSNSIDEIDRLCGKQRQEIDNFEEHLEFAQFWYDLVASKPAGSYFAEYKAMQVSSQLAEEQITLDEGLTQLLQLKKIDDTNPVVLDTIDKIEIVKETNSIIDLIKQNRLEEAVRRAKFSTRQEVKYRIAEILIDASIEGARNRRSSREEIVQLVSWAQEICPYEPAFMEIYHSLGLH